MSRRKKSPKKRTRSGSNVSSRLGKDQLSIHFTSLLDYLKSSKHYCPRNLEMGRNSSPEKSSPLTPEKSSRFLSQKLVLRPASRIGNCHWSKETVVACCEGGSGSVKHGRRRRRLSTVRASGRHKRAGRDCDAFDFLICLLGTCEVNRYMGTVVACVFYLDCCPCLAEGRWVVSECSGTKVDFFL